MEIQAAELDSRQAAYKTAVDAWKTAIQHEEDLASVEHTVADLDQWEAAGRLEDDARHQAKQAKSLYEDGLRSVYFHFHQK